MDDEKVIQENKINEARAVSQLQPKDTVQRVLSTMNKLLKSNWRNFFGTIIYSNNFIDFKFADYEDEEMIKLLQKLYDCLEREQIPQTLDSNLTKNLVLKTVFTLINSTNEALLLHVAKIILFVSNVWKLDESNYFLIW